MTIETDALISILKHTNSGPAVKEIVTQDVNAPVHIINSILKRFREIGLIEYDNEIIEVSSNKRIKLAIHAINQGTDIERVCKVLKWIEFENFAATAFEKNNFAVKRRFRFKALHRRWEIDIIAYIEPVVVCLDCKLWRCGWGNSAITKVAAAQAQRTEVLAKNLQDIQRKMGLDDWKQATLFPAILSLFPGPVKLYNKVPIVPILQLQNFVDEFQGHLTELAHFRATLGAKLSHYLDNG